MKKFLLDYDKQEVDFFAKYVEKLRTEQQKKNNQWVLKNPWANNKDESWFVDLFKKNKITGLLFDGVHVTINQHGLSYDYIAYKNRLLKAYPETQISFSEVYKHDEFSFAQTEKGVTYNHVFTNPFNRDTKNIIGAYCVIKNKRGHFLTLLDKDEIEKHKKKAKTQYIWNEWELEMIYKTVIKKGTRIHYEDIYQEINDEDNKNIDLENKDTDTQTMTSVDVAKLANKKGIELTVICSSYKVQELKDLSEAQVKQAYNRLLKSPDKDEEEKK